jgi:hypothetical protein
MCFFQSRSTMLRTHEAQIAADMQESERLLGCIRPALGHPQNSAEREVLAVKDTELCRRIRASWMAVSASLCDLETRAVYVRKYIGFLMYAGRQRNSSA